MHNSCSKARVPHRSVERQYAQRLRLPLSYVAKRYPWLIVQMMADPLTPVWDANA